MKNNRYLSNKLKALRLAHGYKQVDIASSLGIVRQTYSHYENGDRVPDYEMLYKIAAFYNISINDLMRHTVTLDPDIYYEANQPTEMATSLDAYLSYIKEPRNQKRFKDFDNSERELIYYYEQISKNDQWVLIEISKIMARKN